MTRRFTSLALAALFALAGGCGHHSQSASSPYTAAPPSSATAPDSGAAPRAAAAAQPSAADRDAIRAAIEDRLRSNRELNMDAMQMVVDSVAVNGDQAQAHASFHIKNGGTTGMTMEYFLQRSGSGWTVTNGQPADGNTQLPPSNGSHPDLNSTQSTPSMPDVDAFFKDHPAAKSN